jgi:hypothetical protein
MRILLIAPYVGEIASASVIRDAVLEPVQVERSIGPVLAETCS